MPSSFFLKEDEDPHKILINEEEYIKLVEDKKIREDCISPFVKEVLEIRQKEINLELELKKYINKKDWKIQNEFEGKIKYKNFIKSNKNLLNDLKTFNRVKDSFHKSLNILSGNESI